MQWLLPPFFVLTLVVVRLCLWIIVSVAKGESAKAGQDGVLDLRLANAGGPSSSARASTGLPLS